VQLTATNTTLQTELDTARHKVLTATENLEDERRRWRNESDDLTRQHRNELDKLRRESTEEVDRLIRVHRDELRELERRSAADLEEERAKRLRELQEIKTGIALEHQNSGIELSKKDREIQNMRGELEEVRGELDRVQTLKNNLQTKLGDASINTEALGQQVVSLRSQISFLESDNKDQSHRFEEMEQRLQDALKSAKESKEKLIKEETLRRILFNQVQELKGNIRVMCRVRPTLEHDGENQAAQISFPDVAKESKEVVFQGATERSVTGKETLKTHPFSFDRVFGPSSQNEEVFDEISQLVQSALDGYNVCIFCYGQTGSGKTHTMSSADGMIPRATRQIYGTATALEEKGWRYKMEGSFVEVYNEDIHDLLGNTREFDKKKHEIRHDQQKKQTTITGVNTVALDSPDAVETILKRADANRSVAATKSNERSSRSHSVFILKLNGVNSTTGETSEGTLNLVDLAGSERLKSSGAEGERMKETQNINKSLSCLGDVIGALGSGKEGAHVPYRNSKVC
jgi:kinesin family protein C1